MRTDREPREGDFKTGLGREAEGGSNIDFRLPSRPQSRTDPRTKFPGMDMDYGRWTFGSQHNISPVELSAQNCVLQEYVQIKMISFHPHNLMMEATRRGLSRDLNPGPRAPEARIIPLDH